MVKNLVARDNRLFHMADRPHKVNEGLRQGPKNKNIRKAMNPLQHKRPITIT